MSAGTSQTHPLSTLASRQLPRRVRDLLEGILEFASDELERVIVTSLNELEQQLFKFAEQARNNTSQHRWLEAQRLVKRTRHDLVPRFLIAMESELAELREPQIMRGHLKSRRNANDELSLVDELELDETSLLTEISNRAELRNSLSLYLLGQRFGVLAGRPGFDAESLPIGPQALCRIIRAATDCLELDNEHRLTFFRAFDRQLLPIYGSLVDTINGYLSKNGVLPHLQYVPVRVRPASQSGPEKPADGEARAAAVRDAAPGMANVHALGLGGGEASSERSSQRPRNGAFSFATSAGGASASGSSAGPRFGRPATGAVYSGPGAGQGPEISSEEGFALMRQLLAGRRQLLEKLNPDRSGGIPQIQHLVSTSELQKALGSLQNKASTPLVVNGKQVLRSVNHLKQDLLASLRQTIPEHEVPALADSDGDAIDLVGMLYDNLFKDVRPNSPAASLLSKLQVPLLRVALQDKGFFTRPQHPARQMLNTVAETSAFWLNEDEADEGLIEKMNSVVDRTVGEFNGDVGLFSDLLTDLSAHLQTVSRKAEVAERRHVEAARGKEKLALARERAANAVEALLKQQNLPRFTHTLLSQAWTDVMALTSLRHGEGSEPWKQQLGIAERLIKIARASASEQAAARQADPGFEQEIEQALAQVGYQGDEASAIAERLVNPQSGSNDDAASRTELTMRLKARARLGEDLTGKKTRKTPLTSEEQARLEQLKQVPFGSWFDFISNQQGDKIRRRLSWYSTVTGHVLFVNHRGQKNTDYTLDSLARLMAKDQLRLVEEEKGTLIDRAWNSVMNALRSFVGQNQPEPAK